MSPPFLIPKPNDLPLYEDVVSHMVEGVNLVGSDRKILFTNPAHDALFGYERGEMLGLDVAVCNAPTEHDPTEIAEQIMSMLAIEGQWTGEVASIKKNGTPFWSRASVRRFEHDTHGTVWLTVLSDITKLKTLQAERDNAYLELERLSEYTQNATESLRKDLSREVHDEIGAILTGIRIRLEILRQNQPTSAFQTEIDSLLSLIKEAVASTRRICSQLRPPVLDDLGVEEACRWYLSEWSRNTGISATGYWLEIGQSLPSHVQTDLFRIFQELLTNVAKHAGATTVSVALSKADQHIHLKVEDNGSWRHSCANSLVQGFGLAGIKERVRRMQGEFVLITATASTTASISIPLARD